MHNPDQVREFFRNMADGLVLNSNSHNLLHGSSTLPVDRLHQERSAKELVSQCNDFGVGLPPMAHS
jgi:hypothetical protein